MWLDGFSLNTPIVLSLSKESLSKDPIILSSSKDPIILSSSKESLSKDPSILSLSKESLSKHSPRFRQPFDKLRANGLFLNSIRFNLAEAIRFANTPFVLSLSKDPIVLSLSKDFPRLRQPLAKLRANGLYMNSIEFSPV
jgi:hypothetical protein